VASERTRVGVTNQASGGFAGGVNHFAFGTT
jgi:hypothetical protein